jgi:SAM-dependent MidA family methyltransferase
MPAPLSDRIAALIRSDGPLRFDRFQEMALYDGHAGYYEKAGRVGREGDFVTGASWHPAFARCLVRIAEELAKELGGVAHLVDVGAGEGELLGFLSEAAAGANRVNLLGVERSAIRRRIATERSGARLHADIHDLPPIRGAVICYELFDALPVRALAVGPSGELLERHVDLMPSAGSARPSGDDVPTGEPRFAFTELACDDADSVLERLSRYSVVLEPGQLLEIRPGAAELARALAAKLDRGLLLVFDYGAPARALYGPMRRGGTLEAFSRHDVSRDVLSEPGSRDITAWVDFSELEHELSAAGLTLRGLVSQSRVLAAAGIANELTIDDPETPIEPERVAERNAIAKLFAPGGMGEAIRVLVAERGTSVGESLVRFPGGV